MNTASSKQLFHGFYKLTGPDVWLGKDFVLPLEPSVLNPESVYFLIDLRLKTLRVKSADDSISCFDVSCIITCLCI